MVPACHDDKTRYNIYHGIIITKKRGRYSNIAIRLALFMTSSMWNNIEWSHFHTNVFRIVTYLDSLSNILFKIICCVICRIENWYFYAFSILSLNKYSIFVCVVVCFYLFVDYGDLEFLLFYYLTATRTQQSISSSAILAM